MPQHSFGNTTLEFQDKSLFFKFPAVHQHHPDQNLPLQRMVQKGARKTTDQRECVMTKHEVL